MKTIYYLIPLLALLGCASEEKTTFPIEVGERPESIIPGFNGKLFVTVMNGQEPGDGVVKRIDGNTLSVFASGLDEPKGICFVGGYLVTTDLTKVYTIDASGKKTILADAGDFPVEVLYLNDVAVVPGEDAVYVTDMGDRSGIFVDGVMQPVDSEVNAVGRVFKIDLDGSISIAVDASPKMPNPNGVGVANDGSILIGAFFRGDVLQVQEDGSLKSLANGMRGADAVEQGADGYFYASSWSEGKVWRIDGETGEKTVLIEGMQSAADFYLDEANKRILVPDMKAGTVLQIDL